MAIPRKEGEERRGGEKHGKGDEKEERCEGRRRRREREKGAVFGNLLPGETRGRKGQREEGEELRWKIWKLA